MGDEVVVIVGAGQSGLATAACLEALSVPYLILERDACIASLWRHRCYDRVTLHVAKQFSALPRAPHPPATRTFLPKGDFIRYLDDYAARFRLRVALRRRVESAEFDGAAGRWRIVARIFGEDEEGPEGAFEEYAARYLVVASGENAEAAMPEIPGLEGFCGTVVHSSVYRTGAEYEGKAVLVVGSGNSGMEVALDVAENGARTTSIVIRSQLHIVSKEIWFVAMLLVKLLPCRLLDAFILLLCYLKFGDLSKYGLHRPSKGPMYLKIYTPTYPVFDIGTVKKIKSGEIQVVPSIKGIKGNSVTFSNGKVENFDAIILATGYKSSVKYWLKVIREPRQAEDPIEKGDDHLIGEDGMARQMFPNHWKGKNRLYCAGLARRGIYGSAEDAQCIANDIASDYHSQK